MGQLDANQVIYPLMPKGVEHLDLNQRQRRPEPSDLSFDAERR